MSNFELAPLHFVAAIGDNEHFKLERQKGAEVSHAVGRTASFLASLETKPSGYRTPEAATYHLISLIDPFVTSREALDHYKQLEAEGTRVSRDQKKPHLLDVIHFDHAAKELIDRVPSLRMSQVVQFVTQMYEVSHRSELARNSEWGRAAKLAEVDNATRQVLHGMRNEVGSEQLFEALGLPYSDNITDEDELNGIDERITLHGIEVAVDLKASPRARDEARKKSSHPETIIWSQLRPSDFGDSFRVPQSVAEERAPYMQQALEEALRAS